VPEIVVYVDVSADEAGVEAELQNKAADLPNVAQVDVRREESERTDTVELINHVTLTISAMGGAAGATAVLLDGVRRVVKGVRGVRGAWLETDEGLVPIDEAKPPAQGPE
jgi:hypothetical protein